MFDRQLAFLTMLIAPIQAMDNNPPTDNKPVSDWKHDDARKAAAEIKRARKNAKRLMHMPKEGK